MASKLLAIQVADVNGDPVANATVAVADITSTVPGASTTLAGTLYPATLAEPVKTVFNLGNGTRFSIEMTAPSFFGSSMVLTHTLDPASHTDTIEVNARSPIWGLYTEEASGELGMRLTLIALRVRDAPTAVATTPARDVAPPVVDDPGGVWVDQNRLFIDFFDQKASGFPTV